MFEFDSRQFLSSFMSCNDDFKNMKIAWELHHEIKKFKKFLFPGFLHFTMHGGFRKVICEVHEYYLNIT